MGEPISDTVGRHIGRTPARWKHVLKIASKAVVWEAWRLAGSCISARVEQSPVSGAASATSGHVDRKQASG